MTDSPDSTQADSTQADSTQADSTEPLANPLDDYVHRLAQALQILDLSADHSTVLDAARKAVAAHGADAGPLTAFYVGYAAGSASPHHQGSEAVVKAADVASRTISPPADATRSTGGAEESGGWAATAQ